MANLSVKQEALGVEIKQNVKLPAFFCTLANLKNRFQLLIGLGSPYEEALALEAISHGCIFINPKVRSFNFAFNFSPYVFPIAASAFFEICSSFICSELYDTSGAYSEFSKKKGAWPVYLHLSLKSVFRGLDDYK